MTAVSEPDLLEELDEVVQQPVGRRLLGALAVLCALTVVAMREYLERRGPLPGDRAAAARLPNPRTPADFTELLNFFGGVATPLVALLTVATAAWVVRRTCDRRRAIGVIAASAAAIANSALKIIWGPTPLWDATTDAVGANFPSGHVTYATALFGYLAWLGVERKQREVVWVSLLLIVAMGPTRVLVGAHLPSDVVAGYLFGAAWLIGVVLWTTRRPPASQAVPARDVHDRP